MLLALAALFLVSGILEIPPWYGMSTAAAACIAAFAELFGTKKKTNPIWRRAAWCGLIIGGTGFLTGLVVYIAAWIWAVI